ncbi:MAG TPA: hypothetical protein VJV79_03115 [Polyangiaceae bacterium]|nr:hypothetical protein [Polyangiaceae bacterium]
MRRDPELVKKSPAAAEKHALRDKLGRLGRHLQGYELGLVTVGMVLTFALLALPRASRPLTLPLPRIDRAQAQRQNRLERELASRAEATGLPFELRAVGEAIRHFGHSRNHGIDTGHDVDDLRERMQAVVSKGQSSLLLSLRAVQTQYFLRALAQFEREGKPNSELEELGADFLAHAQHNGWFGRDGRFLADEATRRVLFQLHWADLIGKRGSFPFAPTLNDWRLYYRFLLLHPEQEPTLMADLEGAANAARVRVVNALSRKDPDYPAFFARGYLFDRLGDTEAAASAYRAHLGQHESGPYALLARNYLIHTLQGTDSE